MPCADRPDERGLDEFAEAYGWDIREWSGLESVIAVREISGLAPYIRTAADLWHLPAVAKEDLLRVGPTGYVDERHDFDSYTTRTTSGSRVWRPVQRR